VSVLGAQLGNQMFQYAAARALASARGSELLLYFPPGVHDALFSGYRPSARRWEEADGIARPYLARLLRTSQLSRVLKRSERLRPLGRRRWYENDGFNLDPKFTHLGGDLVLKGYWQSYKYFHHIRNSLRVELRYTRPLSEAAESAAKSIEEHDHPVAIHVRRGEYVTDGWPILSNEYFEKALEMLMSSQKISSPGLFVFSNDPAWCVRELFPGRPKTVVSAMGTSAGEDLHLMSRCRYILISPSTFSWWGAYLSDCARAVLAPFRWFFHDYEGFKHEDIYLPDWIVVRD
jgi:hypothetical protein